MSVFSNFLELLSHPVFMSHNLAFIFDHRTTLVIFNEDKCILQTRIKDDNLVFVFLETEVAR